MLTFGEFRRQLTYKCQWYGKELIVIDRYFPSSKTCSVCGAHCAGLTLGKRHWCCRGCGTWHDRDINAAKTIVAEGMRILGRPHETVSVLFRSRPGCEGPGKGRQDTRSCNGSVPLPVVLVNEASTGPRAAACLEQTAARE